MYRLSHVGKYYKDGSDLRWVLRDLSFEISAGQIVGVEGPSGSGKTTLLALLAGLVTPAEGGITVSTDGSELRLETASLKERLHFRRQRVGFVYQFFNLIPTLTAAENVLLPLELTSQPEMHDEAIARLEQLGLKGRAGAFPAELSGGEQQRVAIARAFAHRPAVILADEPTGNLDRDTARESMDLLWHEATQAGTTVVVASHDERVISRCDPVLSLQAG